MLKNYLSTTEKMSEFGNSFFKRSVLFFNVTAYKLMTDIPTGHMTNVRQNIASSQIIVLYDMLILKYIFKIDFNIAIFIPLYIFHVLQSILMGKSIDKLSMDYFSYYNKILYYLFWVYAMTGTICIFLLFNDMIGKG